MKGYGVTFVRAYARTYMGSAQPPGKPALASPPTLSDEEVVRRVCAGEVALFEILMRRYNPRLFRVARAILRNDGEAEDVVQQTYLSAYANLAQFAERASFATWLTRIALNEALSRSRRRVRLAEVEPADVELPAPSQPTPEDDASRHELTGLVEAAIDRLPEIYRVVFMMRAVQELGTAETADSLGLSEEAVKVRLHRARGLLRHALEARVDSAILEAFPFLGERCDRIVNTVLAAITC
jgi:RNA polymerase sigma-70 factor (ECF subfamily)